MREDLWQVPTSWEWSNLGNIAVWASGGTPRSTEPRFYGGQIPWLIIGDLNDSTVTRSSKSITQQGLDNSSAKMVEKGALLIAMYGSIGKLGIAGIKCSTNQAIAFTQKVHVGIASKYLFYYLRFARNQLNEAGKGGTQQNISQTVLKAFPVCIPPYTEQQRIVAKLQTLLSRVDAAQARLSNIPPILKRFRQSVLAAACSGRLTADWRLDNTAKPNSGTPNLARLLEKLPYEIPETWPTTSLDLLCTKITDGEHLTPPLSETGVPLLSAKDVREEFLDFSDTKFVTQTIANKSRSRCNPERGDILVVSRGATVGRTCLIESDREFCLMGSVLLFKPKPEVFQPNMLEYCFKSPHGLAALIARSGATAQQAIYIRDMKSFPVPVPPVPEQVEIVRRVEALFKTVDALEARYRKAKAHVDKLTQSILAKAFRGELVPQDPNDEPASVLLERIERKKRTTKQPRRRR